MMCVLVAVLALASGGELRMSSGEPAMQCRDCPTAASAHDYANVTYVCGPLHGLQPRTKPEVA